MIHTYRESKTAKPSLIRNAAFPVVVVGLLFWIGGFTWVKLGVFIGLIGLAWALVKAVGKWHEGSCTEIRLSDDGMCELQTKRRVIRLHVVQIRSVQYARDSETGREDYTIQFIDGKASVSQRMADFGDFLTQLKALNPAVDLRGFTAKRWPELNIPEPDGGLDLVRLIRTALFPVIVTGLLVWLAVQTFIAN
jgi:hypothetical protein